MNDFEPGHAFAPNPIDLVRIVDDDPVICESFCYLMTSEGWSACGYPSAEAFLEQDDLVRPGCLVLDVQLTGMSGLALQEHLKTIASDLPIIFVSAYGNIEMAVDAVLRGACNFIEKPVDEERLLGVVERAVLRCHQQRHKRLKCQANAENWSTLTPREKEVARLIAQGLPNKSIAQVLGVALNTVQVHRVKIYHKLGLRSAAQITALLKEVEEA